MHQTAAEHRLGGGASHQSRGTSPRTGDHRATGNAYRCHHTSQTSIPTTKAWKNTDPDVQLRREFAIASVRAHDALVLRPGLFLLGGRHTILPVPDYGPAEERVRGWRNLNAPAYSVGVKPRDTTARHTTHCARRFAPSTALRAVRAPLRAARVHCSPKLLKMGYALIVGHTPAEATGCGQAAGMRRTLLNALM